MQKNQAPLFISKKLIERCFESMIKTHPDLECHLKVFVECFVSKEEPLYLTKEVKWYEIFEEKKGEVILEGGISSKAYLDTASQQYVDGRFTRERPKILFPGDLSQDDISIVDNKGYGMFIVGCLKGKGQSFFIETLRDMIINEIRLLEIRFPFESKKAFFVRAQDWQKFIENKTLADFKELPFVLDALRNNKPELSIVQLKNLLIYPTDAGFTENEAQKIKHFIEEQEDFDKK